MNKEGFMTLPMPQGTSHCSCLEHCFLFLVAEIPGVRENRIKEAPLFQLVESYRTFGHRKAKVDPLELSKPE